MVRSLRHRNFRLFFGGQLISLTGTWMDLIAESWLVYRLTGSSLLLGTMAFASQIPVFLISPIGGTVADRYNRHRLIIATQACSMVLAGILAFLTLSHRVHIWHLFVLAAGLGVVNAFDIPARQAFLMDMVGKEDLMNAIALNSSMFNGARIIGPAIAGILVAKIGEGWCFAANSISFIAVIAGLLLMKVRKPEFSPSPKSTLENIVEGFRFARHTAPVRALLLLVGLVSLVGMPYSVLMPIFAAQILHGGARALGILMGATGVGALIGALALASKRGLKGLSKWVAVTSATFGAALIAFSFSRTYYLSILFLIPVGLSMMIQMASTNTLLQAMVPDQLRGRVIALYSMMFMGMAPFGAFFAGAVAQKIGAPWTLAIGGFACLCGSALFASKLPAIRAEARELILAQGMAGGEPATEMTIGGVSQS
ncbi:MAG: MFS transporter [Terriglobales bacterium]